MVDIEAKSLKLIENNILYLKELIDNPRVIKKEIFGSITYIDEWNQKRRLDLYRKIVVKILQDYDINKVMFILAEVSDKIKQEKDAELRMFWSFLEAFYQFLKIVYELYLLDQILFIITNLDSSEISKCLFDAPFFTNSFYSLYNFNLDISQVTMLGFYSEEDYKSLYEMKISYRRKIKRLLCQFKYQERWDNFMLNLSSMANNYDNDNYYGLQLFIIANSLTFKSVKSSEIKSKDELQLTLFK